MIQFATTPGSVRAGTVGPATGDVWLQFGDTAFPVDGWNDFVVVVLEAYACALIRLLEGNGDRQLVHFLEGPYSVEVSGSREFLTLRALENDRIERAVAETDAAALVQSLLVGADAVLNQCREIGWESTDTDKLAGTLGELRRLVGEHV